MKLASCPQRKVRRAGSGLMDVGREEAGTEAITPDPGTWSWLKGWFPCFEHRFFLSAFWCSLNFQATPFYKGKPCQPCHRLQCQAPEERGVWMRRKLGTGNPGPASLLLSIHLEHGSGFVSELTSMVDMPNQREPWELKTLHSFILGNVLNVQFLEYW